MSMSGLLDDRTIRRMKEQRTEFFRARGASEANELAFFVFLFLFSFFFSLFLCRKGDELRISDLA